MPRTRRNLSKAFTAESQANQRCLAFARKAEQEGFHMVARLFRAVAAAESVHAQNHLEASGSVAETARNLRRSAGDEAQEFNSIYPEFAEAAEAEGHEEAARSFNYARLVEQIHHGLYKKAAERVAKGKDLPETDLFVCRGCGNTVEGQAPRQCPICGAPNSWFTSIE